MRLVACKLARVTQDIASDELGEFVQEIASDELARFMQEILISDILEEMCPKIET